MSLLKTRKVLLGVSGSIAAYKSAHLVREFTKRGAEVQVVMTEAAKDFVTPLTLGTLSGRPVLSRFVESEQEEFGVWNNHVELGLWADLMVIAPASSNTLSKLATGACDNLLSAVYLSAKCPVFVAPAMDLDMYANGATVDNLKALEGRGVNILESPHGELASGLVGKGRMAEPEDIVEHVEKVLFAQLPWLGKNILINAGPTHEHIDPVRFLGNNSSGKMGVALAQAARRLGATVKLVLGPTLADLTLDGLEITKVTSADEMLNAMLENYENADLIICSAAVSDFKPARSLSHKLKKGEQDEPDNISLVRTPDILATLGQRKLSHQYLVGFALETHNGEQYARQKLANKNADAIVLNTLTEKTGFESNTNKVHVFYKTNESSNFPLQSKTALGRLLVEEFNNKWFN